MSKGKKFDQGKPDLSLIPKIAQEKCAEAFMVGEKKYGRYNYTAGLEASRQVGAAMRHMASWFDGEESDPIDGQHHLGAAMACCAMILREMELGTLIDDRFVGVTGDALLSEQCPGREPAHATEPTVPSYEEFGPTTEYDEELDYRYRVVCRRPDGVELTSYSSWDTMQAAIMASDEYTKQYPQCTFLAVDAEK